MNPKRQRPRHRAEAETVPLRTGDGPTRSSLARSALHDARRCLERRREAIRAEIAAYPMPIPACDAQFNHLLDERRRIARRLARTGELLERGVSPDPDETIACLVGLSADVDEATRATIERLASRPPAAGGDADPSCPD